MFNNKLSYSLPVIVDCLDTKLASDLTDNIVIKLILDLLETTGTIRGEKILKKVVEILKYSEAKTKLSDIDQAPKQSQD